MKKIFSKLAIFALVLTMLLGVGTQANTVFAATSLSQVSSLTVKERDDDELTLKWSKVSGATGYQLYQYNYSTETWKKIKTTSKTSYEVENLTSATKYKFKVRAYYKSDSGNVYGKCSTSLITYTEPEEVEGLTITKKTTSAVSLSWNKVSRATKYQIYMYSSESGKYVRVKTVSGTSATISDLDSGTSYKFKVRAYKASGDTKYYGDFSDPIKATTKTTSSTSSTTSTSSSSYIGTSKAKSIALADAGLSESSVTDLDVELDKENGVMVYEVDFDYKKMEYEYEINATTGAIISKHVEAD